MALTIITPSSKSQRRAAALTSVSITGLTYDETRERLAAAGVAGDGLGTLTWRQAAKLSDAELLRAIRIDYRAMAESVIDR